MTNIRDILDKPMTVRQLLELGADDQLEGPPREVARFKTARDKLLRERLVDPMHGYYSGVADRATREATNVERIAAALAEAIEAIEEDLEADRISGDEALKFLADVGKDLARERHNLDTATRAEHDAWQRGQAGPLEWEAEQARRAPTLNTPGRLPRIASADVFDPPARARYSGPPEEAPTQDDLDRQGHPGPRR